MTGLTPLEAGFLLLTSPLGDPRRKPLSAARFRELAGRVAIARRSDPDRALTEGDLKALGYGAALARQILSLLEDQELLDWYVQRGRKCGCVPITRASEAYPLLLRKRLGQDSPGCLWAKGDLELLKTSAVSLVGSRELREENRVFAEAVGRQAAMQGLTLVSGNARGADRTAQEACLQAGGKVVCIVADALKNHPLRENVLYLSENSYEEDFSAQRALSRNRCIHALGRMVFVAQSDYEKGGTWDGTVKNLRQGWSGVACFRDGSRAAEELCRMGAFLLDTEDLQDLSALADTEQNLFDR